MILVRTIPLKDIETAELQNLEQFGFTIVQRGDCLQVWVEGASRG